MTETPTHKPIAELLADLGYSKFESHLTLSKYDVDAKGYVVNEIGTKFSDVVHQLNVYTGVVLGALLRDGAISEDDKGHFDGWTDCTKWHNQGDDPFPTRFWAIACYAMRGSNEGHYVHVDVIIDGKHTSLAMTKTFGGMDHAMLLANIATCLANGTR